jgi:ribosomal protein S15
MSKEKNDINSLETFNFLIEDFKVDKKDTGSFIYQMISLKCKIIDNIKHFNNNHKDFDSQRSMLKRLASIKRKFKYFAKENRYKEDFIEKIKNKILKI